VSRLAFWPVAWAAGWVVAGILLAGECAAQNFVAIPTGSPASGPVPDSSPLRVALTTRDPQGLAELLGVSAPVADSSIVEYVMGVYAPLKGARPDGWVKPTFVIDFTEPSVAALSNEFRKTLGSTPRADTVTAEALVNFVSATVKPSYERDFAIASEIAARPVGDCKAYAVLLVALARAAGIPARVALGVAIVRTGPAYQAFGHAWAELQIDGGWIVADATLANIKEPVRHLPLAILQGEGMGYMRDVIGVSRIWVQRVDVLGPGAYSSSKTG
jgi:transglutaminase-like putative cysteine protease